MLAAQSILDFLDVPTSSSWDLAPAEAIAFVKGKGMRATFNWQQMLGEEHASAFTVAKMMDTDLLAKVKSSLEDALAQGQTFEEWRATITPTLQAAGWWGRKAVMGPDGKPVVAQLGSPSRLQTIYRTNMASAYAAGQWDSIVDQADLAPYLLYDAVMDERTRPQHAAWNGTMLPITHDWWKTHYPPNGWNCRCTVIQLSADEAADMGLPVHKPPPEQGTYDWTNPVNGKVMQIPEGVDPGFATNLGIARQKALQKAVSDKLATYPPDVKAPAKVGLQAAATAAKDSIKAEVAATEKALADLGEVTPKVATRGTEAKATAAITQHLLDNTPYVANAIKAIQKTKAGAAMSAADVLEAAQAKAAQAQQSAHLAHYKQALIAGKAPGKAAQAAFDALPAEAAQAITAQVEQKAAAAAANKAAQAELDAIAAKPATTQAKALAKILADTTTEAMPATEILAKLQLDLAQLQLDLAQAALIKQAEKVLIAGELPTVEQAQALLAMPKDAHAALLAKVKAAQDKAAAKLAAAAEAKAAATGQDVATAATPAAMDTSKFQLIGSQTGSNPGGLYLDPATGTKWYIKTPKTLAHAQNEVLAARLYQAAGVQVPDVQLTTLGGKPAVASRIIDGLDRVGADKLKAAAGAQDGFAVDAWLGNWDVAGAELDNMLVRNGVAYRVDTGGALLYRAQGVAKGSAFGDIVTELDSLVDATKNPSAARVFKGMTADQVAASAKRVLAVSDNTIRALVKEYGPSGPVGDTLADRLIARKAYLAQKFPAATVASAAAKAAAVADAQFVATDGLKSLDATILQAIKGIASRAAKGAAIDTKDVTRTKEARAAYQAWVTKNGGNLAAGSAEEIQTFYGAWLDALERATAKGVGTPATWKGGTFAGYSGHVDIDGTKIKVAPLAPGMAFSPAAAKQAMIGAFGQLAANMDVPATKAGAMTFRNVPLEHQRAITAYTGGIYREVNDSLRAGTASPAIQRYADLLNEALTLAPKYVGEATRGMTITGADLDKFLAIYREALVSGKAVHYQGFVSSTLGSTAAFDGNVIMHIKSKTGVHVNPISLHKGRENEVLLRHGTRFMVTDVAQRGAKWHVYVEDVG